MTRAGVRSARQNGMPLIEYDTETGLSRPGKLVSQTTLGNWSGSVEGKFRTLRAGLCIQDFGDKTFLLYAYFSTATVSAMARTLQAFHPRYALLSDINALEHTYLALYQRSNQGFEVQHLISEMSVLDRKIKNKVAPRFIGYADNRDFFYLLRRTQQ